MSTACTLVRPPRPSRATGATLDFGGSFKRLLDHAARRGNDLEPAALSLAPVIGEVLARSGDAGVRTSQDFRQRADLPVGALRDRG